MGKEGRMIHRDTGRHGGVEHFLNKKGTLLTLHSRFIVPKNVTLRNKFKTTGVNHVTFKVIRVIIIETCAGPVSPQHCCCNTAVSNPPRLSSKLVCFPFPSARFNHSSLRHHSGKKQKVEND